MDVRQGGGFGGDWLDVHLGGFVVGGRFGLGFENVLEFLG